MDLPKAEQAIVNGIYAAVAWLLLDLGFMFKEHGGQMLNVFFSRPELSVGGRFCKLDATKTRGELVRICCGDIIS